MIKKLSVVAVPLVFLFFMIGIQESVSIAAQGKQEKAAMKSPTQNPSGQTELKPLNVNNASAQELQGLPGIGPKTAEEIVKYRDANGPFESVEDLVNVKGIGAVKFQKIRQWLVVQ